MGPEEEEEMRRQELEFVSLHPKEWGATCKLMTAHGEERVFNVQFPDVIEDLERLKPGDRMEFFIRPGRVKKGWQQLYIEGVRRLAVTEA